MSDLSFTAIVIRFSLCYDKSRKPLACIINQNGQKVKVFDEN